MQEGLVRRAPQGRRRDGSPVDRIAGSTIASCRMRTGMPAPTSRSPRPDPRPVYAVARILDAASYAAMGILTQCGPVPPCSEASLALGASIRRTPVCPAGSCSMEGTWGRSAATQPRCRLVLSATVTRSSSCGRYGPHPGVAGEGGRALAVLGATLAARDGKFGACPMISTVGPSESV